MLAQVFIPITVDDAGEHPAHVVYDSEDRAAEHVIQHSKRHSLRPARNVYRRRHANVVTVETDDWKLGYVIVARLLYG